MISTAGKLESVLTSFHTTSQSQQITGILQRGKYSQKKRHIFPIVQQSQNEGKVDPVHATHTHTHTHGGEWGTALCIINFSIR
jgi:hypothetical protein